MLQDIGEVSGVIGVAVVHGAECKVAGCASMEFAAVTVSCP